MGEGPPVIKKWDEFGLWGVFRSGEQERPVFVSQWEDSCKFWLQRGQTTGDWSFKPAQPAPEAPESRSRVGAQDGTEESR